MRLPLHQERGRPPLAMMAALLTRGGWGGGQCCSAVPPRHRPAALGGVAALRAPPPLQRAAARPPPTPAHLPPLCARPPPPPRRWNGGRTAAATAAATSASAPGRGGARPLRGAFLAARAGGGAVEPPPAPGVYYTIAGLHEVETEVKKSRFIAVCAPVSSPAEALEFFEAASHTDARHNCWAYRVGGEYRFNDDGEPGGTAGRPILAAIEGEGVDHVAVLVVRYFGGIKLGAGGLVRAYGGAASKALRECERLEVRPKVILRLAVPFDLLGLAYQLIAQHDAEKLSEEYGDGADGGGGGAVLEVVVDATDVEALQEAVVNQSAGKLQAVPVDKGDE